MFECRRLAQEIEDTEQKLRQLRLPQSDAEAEQLQEFVFPLPIHFHLFAFSLCTLSSLVEENAELEQHNAIIRHVFEVCPIRLFVLNNTAAPSLCSPHAFSTLKQQQIHSNL